VCILSIAFPSHDQAGFTRIGIAKTFIHCDTDKDKNDAIWLY